MLKIKNILLEMSLPASENFITFYYCSFGIIIKLIWIFYLRYFIVPKCKVASHALEVKFITEVKSEESDIMLKPKQAVLI